MPEAAIKLFLNGRIRTMRGKRMVQALAVDSLSGTIIDTGGSKALLAKYKCCKPERIDLEGMPVLPGLTDCHTHFCSWALLVSRPQLDGMPSLRHCLEVVSNSVAKKKSGEWIVGGGWNKNIWPGGRMPSAADLDTVSVNNPVFLWSKDWHTAWVNSAAIRAFNITPADQGKTGGVIESDGKGRCSGILREEAANHYYSLAPKATDAEYSAALAAGQRRFARMGLTGFHTMETDEEASLLGQLHQKGTLRLRAVYYLREQSLDPLLALKLRSGLGDHWLKFGGLKLFADGSLGSQTAYMLQPYGRSSSRGLLTTDPEKLQSLIGKAAEGGIACAVHAIGDAANRIVLDAFEKSTTGEAGLRHRIEHCQLVDPVDIARFARLGVVASVQPIHCPSDLDLIEQYWGTRGKDAYPFGSLKKNKAKLCFGSDAPIETPDPFAAIQAAVTRQRAPADRPPFHPEQRLPVHDAVAAYTTGAAYASGDESWKGTLEPGQAADFVCLSDDVFAIEPSRIHRTKVAKTYIGGKTF
ncbi:MAG TPA: amidohydrolase [Candidatus Edwardsbacteria bacterium]|nr:amidohydrolase [Candidatus Edwardsbacteria bacterium]